MSTKRVAIQGFSGSYHEIAARNYFENDEVEIIPCYTFKDIFKEIQKDNNVVGLMAIENTVAGSILQNYNLLRESQFQVTGEYKLRISHNLAALPGQKIEDIQEVISHPMAIMQCESFLEEYPHLKIIEGDDTALIAEDIRKNNIKGRAAICSSLAVERFELEALATAIETNKRNFTRFLVISDVWENGLGMKKEANKASLVFSLPHSEGSLSKVLTILSFYNINLTKIQSMPVIGHAWEYMFYIDLTFDDYMRYQQSIEAIKPLTANLKNLGEYKIGKQSFDDTAS